MPRSSERHQLLSDFDFLSRTIVSNIQYYHHRHPRTRIQRQQLEHLQRLFALLTSTRYLDRGIYTRAAANRCEQMRIWMNGLSNRMFKQKFRVDRELFLKLLEQIEEHPIFHNNSYRQQEPVILQLAVAMNRLGRKGNGASVGDISALFHIGEGTVCLYTERVIEAVLSLENEYIRWPSAQERTEHSRYMDQNYGFKGCVGMLDGSCIVLETRPAISGSDYFCRHRCYSVNLTAICDHRRLIRFLYVGWPASRHDNFIYEQTPLFQHPEQYFSKYQYVLADVAYTLSNQCVCPYKLPAASQPENAEFNTYLSRARVAAEHTYGIGKGRFMSLKGIPIQVKQLSDFEKINRWIKVCWILHNMAIMNVDNGDEFYGEEEEFDEHRHHHHLANQGGSGKTFRETLKKYVLDNFN